jgi:RimJ/RimL family protein N-acetyltransferase
VLTGEHTLLRAIEPGDLETLRGWRNRPALRRYFREHRPIGRDQQRAWHERTMTDRRQLMFAIADVGSGELVGATGLVGIHWVHRHADFSLYIGPGDAYVDDRYAPDAARVLLRHGFDQVGLHRVWVEVYEFDEAKQRMVDALGFKLEGRSREHNFSDGGWHDSLFYGLLASDLADPAP